MTRGLNGFEPGRLVQALAARRLSQVQLAAMVGVSASTVSKWRSGQQAPEPDTLTRLASVVNVSPEWFTRPLVPKPSAPLFRSNASAHVAARAVLEARLEWAQEVTLCLSSMVDLPEVKLPSRTFVCPDEIGDVDIETAALDCRGMWGLGLGPVPNVALALESAGVILVREETGIAQIEGLSAWSEPLQRPMVLLSADKDNGFRSRFDAAHELGHLVLHRHIERVTDRERHNAMEKQAHKFAGAFLLPAESFLAEVRTPVTLDSLLHLKQRWGVSVAAMVMRLAALGIIDEDEKMSLYKRRSARWGAKEEPGDNLRVPEQPRLLKRTIELLVSSGVMPRDAVQRHFGLSIGDIATLVGLPVRFFDGTEDQVLDFAKLRLRQPQPTPTESDSNGSVIQFRRR
jgi:Zn-dependent peptidase ImmA (M78 family)/transcriptional regulator with XRE-family HTH domain